MKVEPEEVAKISIEKFNKNHSQEQLKRLCKRIKDAANQAVAIASIGAHKEDFWSLTNDNVRGDLVVYNRGKNNIQCIAPFLDNDAFHARELADFHGATLYPRMTNINELLVYVRYIADIPFKVTASNFRKTFASIMYYESGIENRMQMAMMALGHKKETTFRKYLGIQMINLAKNYQGIFKTS